MMQVISTWELTYLPGDGSSQRLRVPETNLEALIHVLIFNGVIEFTARVETNNGWMEHLGERQKSQALPDASERTSE